MTRLVCTLFAAALWLGSAGQAMAAPPPASPAIAAGVAMAGLAGGGAAMACPAEPSHSAAANRVQTRRVME